MIISLDYQCHHTFHEEQVVTTYDNPSPLSWMSIGNPTFHIPSVSCVTKCLCSMQISGLSRGRRGNNLSGTIAPGLSSLMILVQCSCWTWKIPVAKTPGRNSLLDPKFRGHYTKHCIQCQRFYFLSCSILQVIGNHLCSVNVTKYKPCISCYSFFKIK